MSTDVQTCYRHDDRRAGVRCQRCDRPICPDCMAQASVGFHCPECRKEGAQKVYRGPSALVTRPVVTTTLIGINLVAFLLNDALTADIGRLADGSNFAVSPGSLFGPLVADGEWWRIVTSGFEHANLMHIAFNMWALWILGSMLEPGVGRLKFGLIYAAGLFGGSFGVMLIGADQPTVGASGAVFGLMGAAVAAQRNRGINPWDTGLGALLMINLIFTFAVPGISIGGHLGGLVGGFLAGSAYWELSPRFGRGSPVPDLVVVVLGLGLAVGSILLASANATPVVFVL